MRGHDCLAAGVWFLILRLGGHEDGGPNGSCFGTGVELDRRAQKSSFNLALRALTGFLVPPMPVFLAQRLMQKLIGDRGGWVSGKRGLWLGQRKLPPVSRI
jgi:hypothetical protein